MYTSAVGSAVCMQIHTKAHIIGLNKYQINVHVRFIDKNSRLLNLRSLEVIGGHWRPLKVIGGRWRPLEATGGHWKSLEADGGQLRSIEAFNR